MCHLERKNDLSLKRNTYYEDHELLRCNSNSLTRPGGNTIGCLNIKGLSVNNREAKKSKIILYKGN
jgi:hypothetical protein